MISTDPETLAYPKHIAPRIGLGVHEINALKNNGCRFYGRKTCVKWVREFLEQVTLKTEVLPATARPLHRQRSTGNKLGG